MCKKYFYLYSEYILDICNEMMDLYDSSRQKSKSREGSVARSKEGSVTESPGYTPSGSPQVTGSPPSKKKVCSY